MGRPEKRTDTLRRTGQAHLLRNVSSGKPAESESISHSRNRSQSSGITVRCATPSHRDRIMDPALPRGRTAPGRHVTLVPKHRNAHGGGLGTLPAPGCCLQTTHLLQLWPPGSVCPLSGLQGPSWAPHQAGSSSPRPLTSHLPLSPQAPHTSAPLSQTPSTSFFISLATKNQAAAIRGEHLLPVPNPHQLWGPRN